MSEITVVTRIFPLDVKYDDAPNLLKPEQIGIPFDVQRGIKVDPRTGIRYLIETTYCLPTEKIENLQIPGLIPVNSSELMMNNNTEERKIAFSIPRSIPLQELPKVQDALNNNLQKPPIMLRLSLKKIRDAIKKKLIVPLMKFAIANECMICGEFLDGTQKNIKAHMFSHVKLGTYSCQSCKGKYFATANSLFAHSFQHTDNVNYVCPICKFKFHRKCMLKWHYEENHTML